MSEFYFLGLAIEQWPTLLFLSLLCMGIVWYSLRRHLVGGIYDPLFFVLGVAYGINYGIILLLLVNGLVSGFLFTTFLLYAVTLILVFRWVSRWSQPPMILRTLALMADHRLSLAVFIAAVLLYAGLSYTLVSTIGFGLLAETNRFDVARGYGVIIRILDCLSPFIVSCMTIAALRGRGAAAALIWALLIIFILLSAVISGAKVSVLFSFVTVILSLFMARPGYRISMWKVSLAVSIGLSFSIVALQVNLIKNNVTDQSNAPLSNVSNLVLARLVYRVIAFGDTSYLVLPNRVIDSLRTDSLLVRFAAPVFGNTNLSKVLGYDVSNYTVGRQAVLVQTADTAVFGGPTSHFDFFAYVYCGAFGGWVFVIGIAFILATINRSMFHIRNDQGERPNTYLVALVVTLWTRAVLMLMEPAVGFAYIIDVFVIFSLLSFLSSLFVRFKPQAPSRSVSR